MRGWELDQGEPVAGRHYPKDLDQLWDWFPTDRAADQYLRAVRFRNGLACPRCGQMDVSATKDGKWWCPPCRRRFSLTTGTTLEHTKVPLRTWLLVAWFVCQTKIGVSALSVVRITGINYQTAWSMLHKMRSAVDQGPKPKLRGDVEVDETLVGGVDPGKKGRSKGKKQVVVIAAEHKSATAMGRIRMARIPDASGLSLAAFIEENIEPGSLLLTDDWRSYPTALNELAAKGLEYTLKATSVSGSDEEAHEILPHVHRVASLLKRWGLGTHQGAIEGQHLDSYLDEFVFRFNRRHAGNRGLLFWRLVCALMDGTPVTTSELGQRKEAQTAADEAHKERLEEWTQQTNRDRAARHRQDRRDERAAAGEPPAKRGRPRRKDGGTEQRQAG